MTEKRPYKLYAIFNMIRHSKMANVPPTLSDANLTVSNKGSNATIYTAMLCTSYYTP